MYPVQVRSIGSQMDVLVAARNIPELIGNEVVDRISVLFSVIKWYVLPGGNSAVSSIDCFPAPNVAMKTQITAKYSVRYAIHPYFSVGHTVSSFVHRNIRIFLFPLPTIEKNYSTLNSVRRFCACASSCCCLVGIAAIAASEIIGRSSP